LRHDKVMRLESGIKSFNITPSSIVVTPQLGDRVAQMQAKIASARPPSPRLLRVISPSAHQLSPTRDVRVREAGASCECKGCSKGCKRCAAAGSGDSPCIIAPEAFFHSCSASSIARHSTHTAC
jgi:hypothetical protein